MNKQRKKVEPLQNNRLDPNDLIWRLLSEKDIIFLRKSFDDQQIIAFCLWIEKAVITQLLPSFSVKRFIKDVQFGRKLDSNDHHNKQLCSIRTENFMVEILKILHEQDGHLLGSFIEFLYNRPVLIFYRRLSEILSPLLELDIITIATKINRKSLSKSLTKKIEERVRLEFAYWAERFVSSWYKNLPQEEDMRIKGVPIGAIAEYDLMTDFMLGFPKQSYCNKEDHHAA